MYQISLQIQHSRSNILMIWQESSVGTGTCANRPVSGSTVKGQKLTEESQG